ncbi:MAG: hypothetical protein H7138_15290 [Myxococcales bacterium]|nr:hypothetical protein [Myxococcales bacterium]
MVVIGILAAIAIPSYQNQLRKGTRAAAQAVMMDIANKEIFHLQAQRVFTKTIDDLGIKVPDDVSRFYDITVDFPEPQTTPPSFTITAKPKTGTRQEGDGNLTLDNAGTKTPADKW